MIITTFDITIILLIGFLVGIWASRFMENVSPKGNLIVTYDPEDGPYLFLELEKDSISELRDGDNVHLKVITKRDNQEPS